MQPSPETSSWLSSLRSRSAEERAEAVAALSDEETIALLHHWPSWARPDQRAPEGDWFAWLCLCGRGWGKTRTGAEFIRERVDAGTSRYVALVARTAADARDVMVEGESGLLSVFPPQQRPDYEPSKRRITFHTGARATLFSADEPKLLRGPQHDLAWADELAAWQYPEAWDNLLFGLRLGTNPQVCVTTTPRPTQLIKDLIARPSTRTVRGSTYDNEDNLAPKFLAEITAKYEGTRLGRQELYAQLLDDTPGALWTRALVQSAFCADVPVGRFRRTIVAVDPSVSGDGGGDECGLVVCAVDHAGTPWVLFDATDSYTPDGWARRAGELVLQFGADCVVAEANNGGALVENQIRASFPRGPGLPLPPRVKLVHASQGKRARAEPVAGLYEQKRVRHAPGLTKLEDELCTCAFLKGERSPNRLDAVVWGLTELVLGIPAVKRGPRPILSPFG